MARPDDGGSPCNTGDMTIKRLDHVGVVVDDLAAGIGELVETCQDKAIWELTHFGQAG
jgi:hypothetical protein